MLTTSQGSPKRCKILLVKFFEEVVGFLLYGAAVALYAHLIRNRIASVSKLPEDAVDAQTKAGEIPFCAFRSLPVTTHGP